MLLLRPTLAGGQQLASCRVSRKEQQWQSAVFSYSEPAEQTEIAPCTHISELRIQSVRLGGKQP